MLFTAADIAMLIEGEVIGDGSIPITGFAPADGAKAGELTFAENEEYLARAMKSGASAILVSENFPTSSKVLIRVGNARVGFARVMNLFFPAPKFLPGVHPTAVISPSAQIDPSAHLGPHCVIGDRVRVGARAVLQACDCVEADSSIGEDVHLFPNVTIYARSQIGNRVRVHAGTVIGSDGFGYVLDKGAHLKVPQIGNVVLHDDVEIGANVTIDRAALGSTIIGKGSKIDNLVQIGHNVVIGENSIIISQVGIAGSTKLGNNVTLAGQVGLAGHLKIGNNVKIYAQSGVMNDIPDGESWLGTPAQPDKRTKRTYLALMRLPELLRKVSALEKRLDGLPPAQ